MRQRIPIWNICSGLLFTALLVWGLAGLRVIDALPVTIPLLDVAILSLAVFRLTRLFVYDTITQFMRDWFSGNNPFSLRGTIGTLINCSWCVGMWFALIVSFAYFATPYAWYPLFVLALAALGNILQLLVNMMSWRTEQARHASTHEVGATSRHANICHSCGAPPPPTYPA